MRSWAEWHLPRVTDPALSQKQEAGLEIFSGEALLEILVPLLPRKSKILEETLAERQESWGHLPHQAATLPQASPNLSSLAERGHLEVPGANP